MLDFARDLVQKDYPVSPAADEQVTSVVLVDQGGTERILSSSEYAHDFDAQILSIHPSAIQSSDVHMRVEVAAECEPIIR